MEKPFGRDSESSAELTTGLKKYLKEDQIYRYVSVIDGFLFYAYEVNTVSEVSDMPRF